MMENHKRHLEKTFNYSEAIKVGDHMPAFTMTNAYGELVCLYDLLKAGPVILTYIRGDWCGFCMNGLEKLNDSLSEFTRRNATLIVISGQKRATNFKTITNNNLQFNILQDKFLECTCFLLLLFLFFFFPQPFFLFVHQMRRSSRLRTD